MGVQPQPYDVWMEAIIEAIESEFSTNRSDAQAIIESNEFTLSQSWGRGDNPEKTASKIIASERSQH